MRMLALLIAALLGLSAVANGSSPCQGLADKVTQRLVAVRKMSADKAAKCKALSQVISDLTDIAVACAADQKFMDETYTPLAKSVGDEAPKACQQ